MGSFSSICILISFCISSSAHAYISGTVTDVSGAPVAGVEVTFSDDDIYGNEYTTTTNAAGYYILYPPFYTGIEEKNPEKFSLGQNYPNPFNPSTTIPFILDSPGHVSLDIFTISGQRIRTLVDTDMVAGAHSVIWNGSDDTGSQVAAGLYLYRLSANGHTESLKMLLVDGGGHKSVENYNTSVSSVQKTTYPRQFWIDITGVDIFPYEEDARLIHENDVCNFTIQRKPTTPEETIFASIPGGTFQMGDETGDLGGYCRPVHTVTISPFEMSVLEITNLQYAVFLNDELSKGNISASDSTVVALNGDWSGMEYIYLAGDSSRYPGNTCKIQYSKGSFIVDPGCDFWPVTWVTWYGAKAFAVHYGFDLPREAEWEYTCRGGHQFLFGTDDGTISEEKVNYSISNIGHPVPVGSYPKNPYGLYDMSGNVYEFINDFPDEYTNEAVTDPQGPSDIPAHGFRGGSFITPEHTCRSASREGTFDPGIRFFNIGFRVVRRP